jgi:hypothetical protein
LQFAYLHGDYFEYTIQILCNVGIPEAEHDHAAFAEPAVASSISRLMRRVGVLAAIELDGESQGWAIEIENELTGWMLSTEICAKLAITQLLPETHLDICIIASKPSCERRLDGSAIEMRLDPHPTRFARRPPPFMGRCRSPRLAL